MSTVLSVLRGLAVGCIVVSNILLGSAVLLNPTTNLIWLPLIAANMVTLWNVLSDNDEEG